MSNPKNVPLSEARPGDMVFLKPAVLRKVRDGYAVVYAYRHYHPSEIDHIERAPRPLEVGLARFIGGRVDVQIVGIAKGRAAWMSLDGNDYGWEDADCFKNITDLERVDG